MNINVFLVCNNIEQSIIMHNGYFFEKIYWKINKKFQYIL